MSVLKKAAIAGLVLSSLQLSHVAVADPSYEIEPVAQNMIPGNLLHNPLNIQWNPEGPNKSVKIVESEGVPGGMAIEYRVRRKGNEPWDIRMRAPFERDVASGETIEIYFWMRTSRLPRGRDAGQVTVALGRNEEPYDTVVDVEVNPGEDWAMYKVSGVAGRDFPVSESDMGFNFGHQRQTIELGPFYAVSLGQVAE